MTPDRLDIAADAVADLIANAKTSVSRRLGSAGGLDPSTLEREQQIIRHHYFDHMEFIEVGELMGLSKGRISQLHNRALRMIREAYATLSKFSVSY